MKLQKRSALLTVASAMLSASLVLTGCGGSVPADEADGGASGDQPLVVVSTNILGDIVETVAGEQFEVVTIMPPGADPHDFQASAQQVAQINEADVLVVNGANYEEGLLDVIEAAESDGVAIIEAIGAVEAIEYGEAGEEHDEHDGEHDEGEVAEHDAHDDADHDDHDDAAHGDDDHGHHHEGTDPHFFTDPERMAVAVDAIVDFLSQNADDINVDELKDNADAYIDELLALDLELEEMFNVIEPQDRVLLTNHDVFGYFADRFDFEVIGTVIPSGSTLDGASAQVLAELAELIEELDVPAIFTDISASDELAQTVSSEVGETELVELYSESLGPEGSDGGNYIDMVRTNGERILSALS